MVCHHEFPSEPTPDFSISSEWQASGLRAHHINRWDTSIYLVSRVIEAYKSAGNSILAIDVIKHAVEEISTEVSAHNNAHSRLQVARTELKSKISNSEIRMYKGNDNPVLSALYHKTFENCDSISHINSEEKEIIELQTRVDDKRNYVRSTNKSLPSELQYDHIL